MADILVFDTEANGLLDTVDTFHCGVIKWVGGDLISTTDPYKFMIELDKADVIVAHNLICYDLPMLKKLFGYEYKGKVLDTLSLSRLLQPERVGRHSIEAWGERFGVPKPVHEDWTTYSPEMLYRCEQDVEINYRVLISLLEEAEMSMEDLCKLSTT